MAQEKFIRVGTTLYKIVNQPRINGGFVKKRIVWNNETLRQGYDKDFNSATQINHRLQILSVRTIKLIVIKY